MLLTHAHLAVRAFDTVAALQRASTLAELDRVVAPTFSDLGLPYFAAARFFRRDRTPDTAVLFGGFHAGWARRYTARNYAASSQIAGRMLQTHACYTWGEVLSACDPEPRQLQIWHEARDFGLTDGVFTPLRGADGSYVAVVLAGDGPDFADPVIRTAAEVVSAYYGQAGQRLLAGAGPSGTVLTGRQRECLAWVREGKSSSDIADRLGISAETVDEHIAHACRRLGVRTRVQAVVEACSTGLIEP